MAANQKPLNHCWYQFAPRKLLYLMISLTCSKYFFWSWPFCAVGGVNFPHKKVYVVPPTFHQIQVWVGAHFGLLMGPKQRKKLCLWPLYTPLNSPLHVGMVWDGNFDMFVGLSCKLWDFGPHLVPFWRAFCSWYFFWRGPYCARWDVNIHMKLVSCGTSVGWINAIFGALWDLQASP